MVLGPLPPGTTVTVAEGRVITLLWVRVLGFVTALVIAWWLLPFGRLWPAASAARAAC